MELEGKSYPIFFEKNLFQQKNFYEECLTYASSFVLITHTSLVQKIAMPLLKHWKKQKISSLLLSFPPGEKYKTRKTKEYLENQMLLASVSRESAILSLGGGVVSDLAGFIAATYKRSMPLIHLPTTLLGMIDASIGGKVGVNTSFGKNTIGAFYQPKAVFIDPSFLRSLPCEEFLSGLVEMVKCTLIADPKLFSILEENKEEILAQGNLLEKMIFACIEVKKKIVEEDETDRSVRQLLGLGHTLGHAIELSLGYRISHGNAIYLGIIGEAYLSMRKKILCQESFERICALFQHYGMVFPSVSLSKKKILAALFLNKKKDGDTLFFPLLKDIGYPFVNSSGFVHKVEKKEIEEMIDFIMCNVWENSLCSLPS